MRKHKAKQAVKFLEEIQQIMIKQRSPYKGLSKQEAIEKIRATREKLWEEKFAPHS